MNDGFLSVKEVASLLNVHKNTIYRYVIRGKLPYHRLDLKSMYRFDKETILEYTKQNPVKENVL